MSHVQNIKTHRRLVSQIFHTDTVSCKLEESALSGMASAWHLFESWHCSSGFSVGLLVEVTLSIHRVPLSEEVLAEQWISLL